jgi:acetylornithine deacetylase/succinyl-diaminopimelate desuccinylase-like protein
MVADPNDRTVELLQALIGNRCVNDGTPASGHETRNADALATVVDQPGVEIERFGPTPERQSFVARLTGTDPEAPSLCLMGHTDVVPVHADQWRHDPFGGELIDGEIWGRGAVDMLNLTASMAVTFGDLAGDGFRPRGDLLFFAVADEEAGSAHGARWAAEHHADAIRADYVLTENGGLHSGGESSPHISINVGEKGVAWRRLRVRGTPGHGSMPFRIDNALVKAAAVVQRLADYRPPARFHELWRGQVAAMGLPDELAAPLLDEQAIDAALDALPDPAAATFLYSCTHPTFSPNVAGGTTKTNVIPDVVDLEVDIRTLPGESGEDVQAHLDAALGDLAGHVEVSPLIDDEASISRIDTPLWDALQAAVSVPFPEARLNAQLMVGFTDSRVYRQMGAVAYGAGLFSPSLSASEYGRRFHGHDERVDVESLRLTTDLWKRVVLELNR